MKKHGIILFLLILGMPIMNVVAQKSVITFEIGDFQVSTLSDAKMDGNADILIGATPDMLQKYLPDGTLPLEINAFLVRTPDKIIVIDAGLGQKLSDNLQSLGVTPEQINVVLLTHMHGDHIGGMLSDGKVVFPNAELYLSQQEYDYWINSKEERAGKVLSAYKNKVKLFNPVEAGSKTENLFPGLQGIAAYGHTPGHTAYLLESGNARLLIWGDVAHAMDIQIPYPEVAVIFDSDYNQAIKSRKNILDFVSKNKIPIGGMHIAFPAIGDVKANKDGYMFEPFCTCLGI